VGLTPILFTGEGELVAITVDIPGRRRLEIDYLLLDQNGTLSKRGELLSGVKERLDTLAGQLSIHILSGDSFGTLDQIAEQLGGWQVVPAGTEGYRTAEVTLGGVDTSEVSSKTMESLKSPGLYFIGEVLDVNGHLGGFNFQWAWASGHAAAQFV
jgi:predicted flavoprotein YhiN